MLRAMANFTQVCIYCNQGNAANPWMSIMASELAEWTDPNHLLRQSDALWRDSWTVLAVTQLQQCSCKHQSLPSAICTAVTDNSQT